MANKSEYIRASSNIQVFNMIPCMSLALLYILNELPVLGGKLNTIDCLNGELRVFIIITSEVVVVILILASIVEIITLFKLSFYFAYYI